VEASLQTVATLGLSFPALFPMASESSLALNKVSFRGFAMTCVATLGVGFPMTFQNFIPRSSAKYGALWRRHDARRRFSNYVSNSDPRLTRAKYGLLAALVIQRHFQ
jgi:hypothetical protein